MLVRLGFALSVVILDQQILASGAVRFSSVIDARRCASSHPNRENRRSHPMEFAVMLLRFMATAGKVLS